MNAVEISAQVAVQQVKRGGGFELSCSADTAFPLFSPEGERLWIKDWNPAPVFPGTIEFRPDTVFRQGTGDGDAIWTIVDADWKSHRAEYVRVAPKSHAARIVVKVDPAGPGRCYVNAAFTVTAFAEHGYALLESFSENAYGAKMKTWERQIGEYLDLARRQ
jgi:hypothetical protein